jgi:hypothetical protein
MTNKSIPSKPRVPLPVNPEVDVVWSGTTISPWNEKGSLLPPSHAVGSTWKPSVEKLRRQLAGRPTRRG